MRLLKRPAGLGLGHVECVCVGVCVSEKESEIDGCLGYHIHPKAPHHNWAAAGCFYKEPLVFGGPLL